MKAFWALLPLFLFTVNCGKFEANPQFDLARSFVQDCGIMTDEACQTMYWVNYQRIVHSVKPLEINHICVEAAFSHARDMDQFSYFSHDGQGETWEQRMDRFQVPGDVAENIAEHPSSREAVEAWMNSPEHRATLLDPNYRAAGVGVSSDMYVQCFTSEI